MLHGVIRGVYVREHMNENARNIKLYERNVPSCALKPNMSWRPVGTKQAIFPISGKIPYLGLGEKHERYNCRTTFNPGNAKGPVSGYFEEIDTESELRSQTKKLTRSGYEEYIPDSSSDLYVGYGLQNLGSKNEPIIFREEKLGDFHKTNMNTSSKKFNNSTRMDLKNISKTTI